jgi:hypothetical protein
MEDGISKGFVRSSEEVAQNLTMLAQMTGNDPLWQGENGAQRLSEMNSGLEGTTALSSSSDIVAFREARVIAERENGGKPVSYVEAMKVLERGLTPELFREYMKIAAKSEGGGYEGIIEQMRQTFKLNYTNAGVLYSAFDKNKNISSDDLKRLMESFKQEPPPAKSPELDAEKITRAIENWWKETGIAKWDENFPKTLAEELANAIRGYNEATGSNVPVPGEVPPPTPEESRKAVADTLAELEVAGTNPNVSGDEYRALMNNAMEAQVAEGLRQAEIDRMLMKTGMPWDKERVAFFTGDSNPFTKNDDERAFDRLSAYRQFPEAQQALDEVFDILRSFSQKQIKRANDENLINSYIPQNPMTDRTGQLLVQEIEKLREDLRVEIREE